MRLIAYSLPVLKANLGWQGKGQETWPGLAVHLKDLLDHVKLTDGHVVGIMPVNAFSNYLMAHEPQLTLGAFGIHSPWFWNLIPSMEHVIQPAQGAFMTSLGVKRCTKSWEAWAQSPIWREWKCRHWEESKTLKRGQCKNQSGVGHETRFSKDNWESMYFKIFWKSWNDLDIAESACSIDYADTWLTKRVHWLSKTNSLHRSTTNFVCEDIMELDTGVAWASLPISEIQPQVTAKSKLQWLLATLHNTGWMNHCQVHHGSFESFPILNPVDVNEAYGDIASRCHSAQ